MVKILLTIISLLLAACTASQSPDQTSVPLSVDVDQLTFDAEGGELTFTVVTSKHMYMVPGDVWLTCRKGGKNDNNETSVTVTAEENLSGETRQTNLSVVAGDEKILIQVTQTAKGNDEGYIYPETTMCVALSFDDGPNNQTTPQVLDILEEHNVPASFFVIGQNINDSTAEQMKRAISLGCEIQNHSYTHSYMSKLTTEEFLDELEKTDDLVEKYTSTRPTMFRPPYIDHNKSMHDAAGHIFICGVGCQDWDASRTVQNRFDDLMASVKDGDIILLHDFSGNDNTVEALKLIIPELKKRGYSLVTISELFERNGVSPKAHSGVIYTNVNL